MDPPIYSASAKPCRLTVVSEMKINNANKASDYCLSIPRRRCNGRLIAVSHTSSDDLVLFKNVNYPKEGSGDVREQKESRRRPPDVQATNDLSRVDASKIVVIEFLHSPGQRLTVALLELEPNRCEQYY